ncbi:MAG: hypothetical protein K1X67_09645 [Fimbriimonadaceae bacterium]|nr:hypothetical protein [Fimbriimonadaceae bacterium]
MRNKSLFTLTFVAALVTMSHAQYRQVYNAPYAAHTSTVQSFANPIPMPLAAADDFVLKDNFVVNHFRWWGTVSSLGQLARPYYLAIYKDAGCKPGARVFQTWAIPQTQFVGVDCQGQNVYTFLVTLASPLPIPAGHFWFRVAELDNSSVQQGSIDFKWSGYRPVRNCQAGQHGGVGWLAPLLDPCDNLPVDLAFCVLG